MSFIISLMFVHLDFNVTRLQQSSLLINTTVSLFSHTVESV